MTEATRLAAIHAEAFDRPGDTPWSAAAFADLLIQAGVFAVEAADGFILMRAVADEAEILTLAVRPAGRRRGAGRGGARRDSGVSGSGRGQPRGPRPL